MYLAIYCSLTIIFKFEILEQRGKPRIADFVHGSDGLGNISLPPPKSQKFEKTASEFLVNKVSEYPGEVSILALGPLTNLALVSCIRSILFHLNKFPLFGLRCCTS